MKSSFLLLLICTIGFLLLAYNPIGGQMLHRGWILTAFAIGAVMAFLDVLDD